MAAITSANLASTLAPRLYTEYIEQVLTRTPRSPTLATDLAHIPQEISATKRYVVNNLGNPSASSAYTETDTVDSFELSPTATNFDTALYAVGTAIGDWGAKLNPAHVAELALAVRTAVDERLETDVIALASSLTNTTGSASTKMTMTNFVTVTAAYRVLTKRSIGIPRMVLNEVARRDWLHDVMSGGASIFGAIGPMLAGLLGGANQGEWVPFGGFAIASSDRMTAGDTTGKRNIIVGDPSSIASAAYVVPFSMAPTYEMARGTAAQRLATWMFGQHAHVAGISNQARGYNFTTAGS